jgi:hypothetical protein
LASAGSTVVRCREERSRLAVAGEDLVGEGGGLAQHRRHQLRGVGGERRVLGWLLGQAVDVQPLQVEVGDGVRDLGVLQHAAGLGLDLLGRAQPAASTSAKSASSGIEPHSV